jgi:uncharacterized protein
LIYFDTSAAVKLVIPEAETIALQAWMHAKRETSTFLSSQLLRIELIRAVTRTMPGRVGRARDIIRGIALLRIDDEIVESAESLRPATMRSLDAIHLASAHMLGRQLKAFVVYDARLAEAASALGLTVVTPV